MIASSRPGASRAMISSTTCSRPKKNRRSPGSKASRPRYGDSLAGSGALIPDPLTAWMRSGLLSPRSRCGPRSTSSQPAGRSLATSAAVAAETKIWPPSACPRSRAATLRVGPK